MKTIRGISTNLKKQWSNKIASSENGLNNQSQIQFEYRKRRNVVTQTTPLAKKEFDFEKLGPNLNSKHVYWTLTSKFVKKFNSVLMFCLILTI